MSPVNNEFKMASGKCAFLDLAACAWLHCRHFFSIGRQRKKVGKAFQKKFLHSFYSEKKFRQSFELKKTIFAGKISPPPIPGYLMVHP
jgi:hypothetical protein